MNENKTFFCDQAGLVKDMQCKLCISNKVSFIKKSYLVPHLNRAAVQKEISDILQQGIIERFNCPFSNPLVVVIKKGRVC